MKIKVDSYVCKNIVNVSDYVEACLEEGGDDMAEVARLNAISGHKAIGRLCEILAEKNILTADDIELIAEGYVRNAEFIGV
jgi:hypothetical protein